MSVIRTLASTENPLFSQASMSAAAAASSRRIGTVRQSPRDHARPRGRQLSVAKAIHGRRPLDRRPNAQTEVAA
jgi:hypothetical protein